MPLTKPEALRVITYFHNTGLGLESQLPMQKISQVLTTVQLPAGLNSKPTANCTTVEADQLLIDYADLINPKFKAWYCSRFYALGCETVAKYASQAKVDGKDPRKLFSYLLKKRNNY